MVRQLFKIHTLIVIVSHTNSFTFNTVRRCALTMRTQNFFLFCFLIDIYISACSKKVFFGLEFYSHKGGGI